MNRRDWLKLRDATGHFAAFPSLRWASTNVPVPEASVVNVELKRLNLQHTWTTTMSSSTYRETVNVRYARAGITGYGEGAPIIRYKEFPAEAKQAIEANLDPIAAGDPASLPLSSRTSASASGTISARPWPPSILRSWTGSAST